MKKILIMAALLLTAGCMRDGGQQIPPGADSPVEVATRAAIGSTAGGLTIGSVRIIAIDNVTGAVVFNRQRDTSGGSLGLMPGEHGDLTVGDFIISLLPGTYDFRAVVNELAAWGLDNVTTRTALEAVTLQRSAMPAESAMVCVGGVENVVISNTGPASLDIPVVRVATKLSVRVRKETDDPDDTFSITDADLSGVPRWSYLMPGRDYDGTATDEVDIFAGTPVAFIADSETYTEIVSGYLLPEYPMADPDDATKAISLNLTADYTTAGGATLTDNRWNVTLPAGEAATSFEMLRGTHYVVNVTIRRAGGFDYYIVYDVGKWDKVGGDTGGVTIGDNTYSVTRGWTAGTTTENGGNTARVRLNESVTMEFTMAQPVSGRWTAQLSNPSDFYFDTVEGVRSGIAREGFTYRIVIRPRGDREDDVSTELYITIDNGVREIEWDLNQDGTQGSLHRYVIKQIPR